MAKSTKNQSENSKKWEAKLSHKIRHTILTVVITLVMVAGAGYAYMFFTQDVETSINHTPGVGTVKTIASPIDEALQFNENLFAFKLPPDWKKTGQLTTGPTRKYSYQATKKNQDNRYLDVYVDQLPLTMAVNKVVAVRSEGEGVSHGMVSDNCTTFTNKTGALSVPAKWDGVDFLCDMDSASRNVVGTSAPGSINKVELVTPGFTKHQLFFVYTDNNYSPDYNIFYNFLDSFEVR